MGKEPQGSKPRELPPAKTYGAIICGIYEIGHKKGTYGPQHQFVFQYSLHSRKTGQVVRDAQGEPFTVIEFLDFYLGTNKASDLLKTFMAVNNRTYTPEQVAKPPRGLFAVESLLDRPLQVTVVHKVSKAGKTRASIDARSPVDEDDTAPEPALDSAYWEIPERWDGVIPESVPGYIARFVMESDEFRASGKAPEPAEEAPSSGGTPAAPDRNPPFRPTQPAPSAVPGGEDLDDRF